MANSETAPLSLLGQYAQAQHPNRPVPDSGLAPFSKKLLNRMKKGDLVFQGEVREENVTLETVQAWTTHIPGMRQVSQHKTGRTTTTEFAISTWEGAAAFASLHVGAAAMQGSVKWRGRAYGNLLVRDRDVLQLLLPPILISQK